MYFALSRAYLIYVQALQFLYVRMYRMKRCDSMIQVLLTNVDGYAVLFLIRTVNLK